MNSIKQSCEESYILVALFLLPELLLLLSLLLLLLIVLSLEVSSFELVPRSAEGPRPLAGRASTWQTCSEELKRRRSLRLAVEV